jgi:XTP/dITP diphosphohydrolase
MKILIGTHNKNKFGQFERIFEGLDKNIELLSLNDLNIQEDVEEDSDVLLENAKKKARYYGEKSGFLTLSDDLGLFVDALGGEPGVHAKRWLSGTDKDRYIKILERMEGVPAGKRTCRYKAVLVAYIPEEKDFWIYEQSLEGEIADRPKEGVGFGYDPIVIINGKYYSEFSDEERFKAGHRGLGAKKLLKHLFSSFGK